jgi:WD40 repeat protein
MWRSRSKGSANSGLDRLCVALWHWPGKTLTHQQVNCVPRDCELARQASDRLPIHLPAKSDLQGDNTAELVVPASVPSLAYTPNGKTIAAVHRAVALIDARRAKPRQSLMLTDFVQCMAFSRDGTAVAAGDRKGVFRIWDVHTGESQARIDQGQAFQAVVFAANGQALFTADATARVVEWDRDLKKQLRAWDFPGPVAALALSADDRHLATANANGTVYILRLP